MQTEDDIAAKLLAELQPICRFALIFGSLAQKQLREDSDIDVAIFLGTPTDSWKLRVELARHFERDLDLVILDTTDPIITMQVLAQGRLLFAQSMDELYAFKARKISEYLDFKRSRKVVEDNLLRHPSPPTA